MQAHVPGCRTTSVRCTRGDPAAAERAYRRVFKILDELGDEGTKSSAAANLGHVLCALERFDEAERYAAIARTVAAEDDVLAHVAGRQAQALVLASRGETEEAERLAREAVRILTDAGAECPTSRAMRGWISRTCCGRPRSLPPNRPHARRSFSTSERGTDLRRSRRACSSRN